jgi:glycerol-3-phosphate acyltransferase PlsX
MKKIVVDIYGGDNGPEVVIDGALSVLAERKDIMMVFAGDKEIIAPIAQEKGADESRIEYLDTKTSITNHDDPREIFHGYEGTSLVLALEACKKDSTVIGMLSCGSTGAILLGSIFRMGLLPGITHPCLACSLPTIQNNGHVILLDCGARLDSTPEDLVDFAIFGNAYAEAAYGIKNPRVGLLNVGSEEGKGSILLKTAYPLIKALPINFCGNMEGNDLLMGNFDVCVTDGFAGNVMLKNAEAVALTTRGIALRMADKYSSVEAKSALKTFGTIVYTNFAYNDLGCSILVGPSKIVAKPHGKASEKTIVSSLHQLLNLADGNLIAKLSEHFKKKEGK